MPAIPKDGHTKRANNGHPKRVYSVAEAARLLGVSRSTAYKLNRLGQLGFAKIAGRTVVPGAEIDRLLAEIEAQAQAQRGSA